MSTNDESVVTWETPAEKHTYPWAKIANELRANPGEWAKIFDLDRASLATAIRIHGIAVLDPDLGFEVSTRNNDRGEPRMCTMYLRFNPDKAPKGR